MSLGRIRSLIILLGYLLVQASALGNVPPEVFGAVPATALRSGEGFHEVDLSGIFRDPDVAGSVVRVSVRIGTTTKPVDIALDDAARPITVANFLRYVRDGRYTGSFFHRSVPGFVVQSGGFFWNPAGQIAAVPSYGTILNEPGATNVRGTIAMAKVGGDPNSATSQWFINLADNSLNLDAQNGGFTVFGHVVGSGMDVIDEVAALPIYNAGSALNAIPLKDVVGTQLLRAFTVETSAAEVAALSFTADSASPGLVGAAIVGGKLRLSPNGTGAGSTQVTVHATDLDGATTDAIFSVQVTARSAGWLVEAGGNGAGQTLVANAADASGVSGDATAAALGTVPVGASQSRIFTVRNDGATLFTGLTITKTSAPESEFAISNGPGATTLAAGESTTFTVTFTPGAPGARSATFRAGTADPSQPSIDLVVSATAYTPAAPQVLGVQPVTLEVGLAGTVTVPEWRQTMVTATDVEGLATFVQSPGPGEVLGVGPYTLTFTATDILGLVTKVETTLMVRYPRASAAHTASTGAYATAPVPATGSTGLPSGSNLVAFGTPAMSDLRHVAARVTIQAGKVRLAGIYREDATGQSELVARQDGPGGVSGAVFKSFQDPLLSGGGKVAFGAKLKGPKATQDDGVWSDLFGSLAPVLREGEPIPGLGGLRLKTVTSLALTDDALLALVKVLPQPGVVANVSDVMLVRVTGPVQGTLLARTGVNFQGSLVKQLSVLRPALHSEGQGRWQAAAATLVKLTLQDRRTVVVRVAANGDQTALLQAGADDPHFTPRLSVLGLPGAGGTGVTVLATKAALAGTIKTTNDSAVLWAADGVNFSALATEDASAGVTGGAKFAGFSDAVANDQGAVLFLATLRGGTGLGANLGGLWQSDGAGPGAPVVRLGAPATDENGNQMTDANWSAITTVALPDGPGAGPIVVAKLAGRAVKPSTKTGLWMTDSAEKLRLVLRTGTKLTLPTGEKTISAFTVLNALPGSFGARRSYNAAGALAVQATFTDRTQAILRVEVP